MIKVECESCKAPYELDPKRIPDRGMKMRCPKCGTSFTVGKTGVVPAGSAAPVPSAAPPPPVAPPPPPMPPPAAPAAPSAAAGAFGKTMMGAAPQQPPAAGGAIAPPVKPRAMGTVVGIAPPDLSGTASPPAAEAGAEVPAVKAPGAGQPPTPGAPAPKAPLAPSFPAAPPAAAPGAGAFGGGPPKGTIVGAAAGMPAPTPDRGADLPAVKAPAALDAGADLPAVKASAASDAGGFDLPRPKQAPVIGADDVADLSISNIRLDDLPAPKGEVDLPAPKAPTGGADDFGGVDLPAPKAGTADTGFGGVDLPAPKAGTADTGFGGVDLPAPKGAVDLPAPKGAVDLPAPKGAVDLPAPKGSVDLPAPRGAADLPMPKSDVDLPAVKPGGGFGDLDLPTPKTTTDLPATKGEDSFADLNLPVPKPPSADEASFGDIDLPDLPAEQGDEASFADIELPPPKAARDLLPPKEKTVQGVGMPKAGEESSFGDLNLGGDEGDSDLPPSLMGGGEESSFADIDIGGAAPPADLLPPSLQAEPEELDLGDADLEAPLAEGEEFLDDEEYDEEYDEEFDEEFDEDPEDDAGGMGFGEVSLGEGGEAPSSDEMEFGIDPDEATDDRGFSLPPDILRRQRGEEFDAKQAALGRRAMMLVVRLVAVLVLVGGAGLGAGLATDHGYFGIYYFERFLPEAGDPAFVRQAIEKAEKAGVTDIYPDVRRSLKELGAARRQAGLNRALLTRSLLHEGLYIARFGEDPAASSRAAAIVRRLEERKNAAPGIELALAADAARRKAWDEAATKLERARGKAPTDPYVELLAGEVALRQGKPDLAEKAFGKALKLGGGARAQWGLTRVVLAGEDEDAKIGAVDAVLELSPNHVEARIEQARIAWQQGRESRAQFLLQQAMGLEPLDDGQYLWTSKQAKASGHSVLGYIHESRGRLNAARKAYDHALSADPYRAEALLGAGRVLLRDRRANDALARFESARNAATKGDNPVVLSGRKADVEAQLGMGRAQLALNHGPDAKRQLEALASTHPNDAEILRALGRAEQQLGNGETAEAHFRKAIELAPEAFDGYLALSQLFFKENEVDKASMVLSEAAARVEETAEMRRMLGESELKRNKLDSAIHEFQRALELDPLDTEAKFGLGVALRKNGRLNDAKTLFGELGNADDAYAGLAVQKGLLFEAEGQHDRAVKAYSDALEKDADDPALLLRLGAAQVAAGQIDDAEQTLQKVIREMPNSAEAEYFIGRVAFARGRTPDALTHFDRALSLDGTQGEFHLYAARAALEMRNLGRTLEEVEAAISFDPSLGDAFWVRGMVRLRMGAVKDALRDLYRAIELNPSRYEAYASIGDSYDQLGKLDKAVAAYKQALAKDPNRGQWWYRVARIRLDQGSRSEAGTALKRAIGLGDEEDPRPRWLPDAYRLAGSIADANRNRKGAIAMYRHYLEIAPNGHLDRPDVERRLTKWGVQLKNEEEF